MLFHYLKEHQLQLKDQVNHPISIFNIRRIPGGKRDREENPGVGNDMGNLAYNISQLLVLEVDIERGCIEMLHSLEFP